MKRFECYIFRHARRISSVTGGVAEIVDADDIQMTQACQSLGLKLKPRDKFYSLSELRLQQLDLNWIFQYWI